MALLGHSIDECRLMTRLSHLGSFKLKLESKWNYVKMETIWKWKYGLIKIFLN